MKIKRICSVTTLIGSLLLANQWLAPSPAHAFLFLTGQDFNAVQTGPEVIMCLVLFPVCVLDDKSTASSAVTAADLVANGYGEREISQILADQHSIMDSLKEKKLGLKIGPNDTWESIEGEIRSVYPAVSPTYLHYFRDFSALK